MPLPKPNKNEEKSEFVQRFMSSNTAQKEFKSKDQRLAVANEKWKKKK